MAAENHDVHPFTLVGSTFGMEMTMQMKFQIHLTKAPDRGLIQAALNWHTQRLVLVTSYFDEGGAVPVPLSVFHIDVAKPFETGPYLMEMSETSRGVSGHGRDWTELLVDCTRQGAFGGLIWPARLLTQIGGNLACAGMFTATLRPEKKLVA